MIRRVTVTMKTNQEQNIFKGTSLSLAHKIQWLLIKHKKKKKKYKLRRVYNDILHF